jgi:hypothetical protein
MKLLFVVKVPVRACGYAQNGDAHWRLRRGGHYSTNVISGEQIQWECARAAGYSSVPFSVGQRKLHAGVCKPDPILEDFHNFSPGNTVAHLQHFVVDERP